MRYAIQVNASPYHANVGYHAYRFIEEALVQGHEISRVFFYYEGIYHAFKDMTPRDDELNLGKRWSGLANKYGIDLLVCISAAQRRGLLHEDEAKRLGKFGNNLAEGFRIGGLGQWAESVIESDRVLVFG